MKSVFLLKPKEPLYSVVLDLKKEVHKKTGDQLYLLDTPHTTMYAAEVNNTKELDEELQNAVKQYQNLSLETTEVLYFKGDVITGKETICFKIEGPDLDQFKKFQNDFIQKIKHHRSKDTLDHFEASKENLPVTMQASLKETGYPFVGKQWVPHVTIGQFTKEMFPIADKLITNNKEILQKVEFESLQWCELRDDDSFVVHKEYTF